MLLSDFRFTPKAQKIDSRKYVEHSRIVDLWESGIYNLAGDARVARISGTSYVVVNSIAV